MLSMFKGELTLTDILNYPKKRLLELRDARNERLEEEEKYAREAREKAEKEAVRNQILSP